MCLIFLFSFFFSSVFGRPAAYGTPRPGITSEPQPQTKLKLRQQQICNLLCQAGIKPASQYSQDTASPVVPQQKLQWCLVLYLRLKAILSLFLYMVGG